MKRSFLIFIFFPVHFILALDAVEDNTPDSSWVLVWSDEFDSTNIDNSKWGYDIGTGEWGWGNDEQQYYTSTSNNSFIEDGKLVIRALQQNIAGCNYTSARMVTRNKGDWTYGRVEIKAMLPSGIGTWPAIWMLPTDYVYGGWPYSGEIDIMEHVGFDPNVIHGTVHTEMFNWWNGYPPPGNSIYISDAISNFHVYALEWTEDYLKYYVDDVHYFTYTNNGSGNSAFWPFDQRFHLLLNIAIGGTWGGQQGIDDSIFPVRMEVDYVRIYQDASQISTDTEQMPNMFVLHNNYPNPFNPITQISYELPQNEFVKLTVYDLAGRKVKELVNSYQLAGRKTIQWDATNTMAQHVSAGVYFYQITIGDVSQAKKMVLLK